MKKEKDILLITSLTNPNKNFISGENFALIHMNRNPTFYPVELWAQLNTYSDVI